MKKNENTVHGYNINVNYDNLKKIENFNTIPNNWVLWGLKERTNKDGKKNLTKPPINPRTLGNAMSNESSTWTSFDFAMKQQLTYKNSKRNNIIICGIGLMLPNTNFIFVDLDHCIDNDGNLSEIASTIVKELNTYTEKSPSGEGLRLLLKDDGTFDDLRKELSRTHNKCKNDKLNIEVYSVKDNRYCTFTGDIISDSDYKVNTDMKIKYIYREYWKKEIKTNISNEKNINISEIKDKSKPIELKIGELKKGLKKSPKLTNEEIINIFKNETVKEGKPDYYKLFCTEGKPGDSNIDQSVMNKLAFYTQDVEQLCDIMRKSPRCRVDKFIDRDDYLERTANNAISILNKTYQKKNFNIKTDAGHEAFYHYYQDDKLKLDYDELVKHIQSDDNHITFNTPNGFYSYNDGFYERLSKNNIKQKLIEKHVAKQYKSTASVNEVFERLCRNEKKVNVLNNFNDLLIFNNCVLKFDMKGNYEIKDHNHSYMNTYKFKVDYESNTKCLMWEKFLNDVLPKDQQKILQEMIGYVLLPDNSAKKFFALYGVGDSGKSVILRVIQKILGSELTSSITLQKLSNPNSQFDTSSLYGKLANIIGDLSSAPLQDSSVIKMLTGDDAINAQEKFGKPFDFYNKARLICSMNNLPKVIDKNNEFYNRLLIIPFETAIPVEKQDKKLIDKFNFTGIVNWAIEGLQRLLINNLNFSITSVNESILNQYIKDNNNVIQYVDEVFNVFKIVDSKTNIGVKLKDAYDYYRMFCQENGYSPLGRNKFKSEMQNCNITYSENCKDIKGNRFRGFKNVTFKEQIKSEYSALF